MRRLRPLRLGAELDRPLGRGGVARATTGIVVVALAATAFGAIVDATMGSAESSIVILFGVNAVLVVGLQTFVGNTGIMSFGNVAFMGAGAYAAGILTVPVATKGIFLPDLPGLLGKHAIPAIPALLVGGIAGAIVGLAFGLLVVRLPESTASIVTFALLVIVNTVFQQATSFTRGNQTFIGVPEDSTFPLVFGTLILMVAVSALFKWSPAGLRARAVREDPIAAEAAGIRISTARLWPFVLSAFISGVGGALWAFQVTAFSASDFYIPQVIVAIAMMILGGYRSVTGALLGATVMSIVLELARHLEDGFSLGDVHVPALIGISQLLLGVTLILVLRLRPAGIAGLREVEVEAPRRPS